MTGVPAAQLVAEEAAMVKEENRKREAIQKYEEFLKKFYKQNINQIKKTKATVAVNPLSSDCKQVNKQEKTRNSMQGKNFSEDVGQTKDNYTKRGDAIDVQRDAPKKKLNDDLDISEAESEKENDDQE